MKIFPSRTLLLLLFTALLLHGTLSAQDGRCCECDHNGTSCSACCYSDQTPRCPIYNTGSLYHCGCYCEPVGGGEGGGGGGVGCSRIESRVFVVGVEPEHNPRAKLGQPGDGLLNPGRRRDGIYNFEEWALVAPDGGVLGASTPRFAESVHALPKRFLPRNRPSSPVLVIEDADHPQNGREIPVPSLAPLDMDAGLPASAAGQELWFRAEVGDDGVVDQVVFLNVPEAFKSFWFNDRLREHLRLRYADEKRHRVVVFGLLRANAKGRLVLVRSRVLLPKCCCNGSRCV